VELRHLADKMVNQN